jgi:hypothetical protein
MFATSLAFACLLITAEPHFKANPVYHDLLTTGVEAADHALQLPSPTMPDGLDATAQQAALEEVVGRAYPLEMFERNSVVAPQIIRMDDVQTAEGRMRRVDVYFLAYGDLEAIASKAFLEGLLGDDKSEQDSSEGRALTSDDLAKRGITIAPDAVDHEGYGYGAFEMLNKVKVSGVAHSYWSKSDDSIVMASKIDPRFQGDPEFSNQWRPIERTRSGEVRLGDPHPYRGSGEYLKITRMARPAGALFVELHTVYDEPQGWFGGANLLTSKIPAVVQNQVRAVRRELLKAK